jgi:nicotinamidase-related amidase
MTSMSDRDPLQDHLLNPANSALVLIDYQPAQIYSSVSAADPGELIANVVALAKVANLYGLPIVLSTVQVANGVNQETIPQLREQLPGVRAYDRTSINAWQDTEFVDAVRNTGRHKLIMGALWTEVCLTFPCLDAMRDGFEVFPVVDAVAGTSKTAHDSAIQRMIQAGAQPVTWLSVLCELQRDWGHTDTAEGMLQIALERGGGFGTEIALKLDRTTLSAA